MDTVVLGVAALTSFVFAVLLFAAFRLLYESVTNR